MKRIVFYPAWVVATILIVISTACGSVSPTETPTVQQLASQTKSICYVTEVRCVCSGNCQGILDCSTSTKECVTIQIVGK